MVTLISYEEKHLFNLKPLGRLLLLSLFLHKLNRQIDKWCKVFAFECGYSVWWVSCECVRNLRYAERGEREKEKIDSVNISLPVCVTVSSSVYRFSFRSLSFLPQTNDTSDIERQQESPSAWCALSPFLLASAAHSITRLIQWNRSRLTQLN